MIWSIFKWQRYDFVPSSSASDAVRICLSALLPEAPHRSQDGRTPSEYLLPLMSPPQLHPRSSGVSRWWPDASVAYNVAKPHGTRPIPPDWVVPAAGGWCSLFLRETPFFAAKRRHPSHPGEWIWGCAWPFWILQVAWGWIPKECGARTIVFLPDTNL